MCESDTIVLLKRQASQILEVSNAKICSFYPGEKIVFSPKLFWQKEFTLNILETVICEDNFTLKASGTIDIFEDCFDVEAAYIIDNFGKVTVEIYQ